MSKLRKGAAEASSSVKVVTDWLRYKCSSQANSKQAERIISAIRAKYEENANSAAALKMKKYMRNQFEFYGIASPPRKALSEEVLQDETIESVDVIYQLLAVAWTEEKREFQYFGIGVVSKYCDLFVGESNAVCMQSAECIKTLLTSKSWWDSVDALAENVVGYMVQRNPDVMVPLMDEWIDHDNMWLRRTAIIHQLAFKEKTDSQRLFDYSLKRAHETEFFIQKAIGWALRQYARKNATGVRAFCKKNKDTLSKLSYKEAMKHL